MQIHFGVELLQAEWPEAVVCIGTFDGVHQGHRAVILTAAKVAAEKELPLIVLTFDRHPAKVLNPGKAPQAVAPLSVNLREFEKLGVGLVVILPFNAWLSRMSAEDFLQQILRTKLRAGALVVGHDFALGNGREGTTEWLAERIATTVVEPFLVDGERVSSSVVRSSVQSGEVALAGKYLGRPFELHGFVVGGQKLGRTLGFPTANIARSMDQVLPTDGVYAATFECSKGCFKAALAIGTRPAVGGGPRSIEAFLLDYPGDSLYGEHVVLRISHFIRPELNFPSLDALVEQMHKDVEDIRKCLHDLGT